MAELTLSWSPNEDYGILDATVRSGEFSGHGYAPFNKQRLEKFIASLRVYPISISAPPTLEGGNWIMFSPDGQGPAELAIAIKPYNGRGAIIVRVDVTSEIRNGPDEDLQSAATVRFLTNYEALGKFASDFQAVLDGRREEACLKDTPVS
ncbi:hypothetical protein [Nitrospirillum viridazoti]|uniref:hypothetical protein n=1 Tax=Nitrospirillum viridazoti TaxID=3144925 RepID=UPI00110FEE47|nr:hypothetical protein [Nitrospirillum amazonense]